MMVHTMVNVLGTPVRAKGERKRRECGRKRGRSRRKSQEEAGREKGGFPTWPRTVAYIGSSVRKDASLRG